MHYAISKFASDLSLSPFCRIAPFLLLSLLLLFPLAAHAQDDPGGQNNPSG